MSDCERLRRAGPLMSPSINLQHASQSKHRHSVIVKKPQHTAPYINTLFSQSCQNKGFKGKKKKGPLVALSPSIFEDGLYTGLKIQDKFQELPSF